MTTTVSNTETRTVGEKFKTPKGKASRTTTIKNGDDNLEVTAGDRNAVIKAGDDTLEVTAGHRTAVVKAGDDTLEVTAGAQTIKIGKSIQTEAKTKIELKVGPSKITIDPSGITLNAPSITLQAVGMITINGALVKINC
jgi:type VI secretion system secreted protein VgrG